MAGGIDWFRWHHGSVSDQKFILVAKRSGASVAEVIAVWACLLEAASASDQRGNFGAVDYEAMDCALGMQDGRAQAIHEAMASRGVVTPSGDVAAWEKRQPKRERADDNSADRVRAFREKQRQAEPCNATERQETPRGEKRREEKKEEPKATPARKRADAFPCPDGVTDGTWQDWLTLRKSKRAPVTGTVLREAESEAKKAGMSLDAFLRVWCARGSQGLQADWLKPHERGSPKAQELSKWIKGTSLDPDFRGYDDGVIDAAPALR